MREMAEVRMRRGRTISPRGRAAQIEEGWQGTELDLLGLGLTNLHEFGSQDGLVRRRASPHET